MSTVLLRSRLKGALYGLAIGYAVGVPYEFKGRGIYTASGNMEPSFTFVSKDDQTMPPGTRTDDTSTARKLLSWYEDGYLSSVGYRLDIGNATREALTIYSNTLRRGAELTLAGSSNALSSGNGSLFRLAPVPVFYHNNPMEALTMSDLQSKITHSSQMCIESCRLGHFAIVWLLRWYRVILQRGKEEASSRSAVCSRGRQC
ncbi:hypothetical protein ACEPAI_1649 [Sanghuangporus weigelae]